jgi:glycosyltransferase involved in cell wall biosynthesis/ribosomal protein S18 acetylase RimI-like enzyme
VSRAPRVAHVATVDLTHRFLLLGQLRALREEGFEVTAVSAPGPWVGDLEAEGIRHVAWHNASRSWDPLADVRAFAELVGILRRGGFDLVHTHNPKPGILGRIGARVARVPCVANTVHGLYATPQDSAGRRAGVLGLEWIASRCSDLELYQSEEDLEWARRLRVARRGRAIHLGNGIDLATFDRTAVPERRVAALRAELGIPEGSRVVGQVGRLVAEKGGREFLRAARSVRRSADDVVFLAIGDVDPAKADSLSTRELAEAAGDVVVTGWREDVRDLLAILDVFVLASHREGLPRSAIEAAAMGLPLVLTDIRGCREVVRPGIEGLLVPPGDADRLSEAVVSLLEDPATRERMGTAARERAVARFDERRVIATVVEVSRRLLARRGLPTGGSAPTRIRPARPADAAGMARIHREALPEAFLSTLGERFLRRLYTALATDPAEIALVAENGHGVVGFATGSASVGRFYRRFLLRHGAAAAVAALPALARPGVVRRVRETASHPGNTAALPAAELLSIAVEPGYRSEGVGRLLAEGIVDGLAARGAGEVKVVVAEDNAGANRFYERLGFHPAARISVHGEIPSNVWVIRCPR